MNDIIQECITKRKIVLLFLKYPEREFTVNEMSGLSGISYATAWRFIRKLDKAGVILTKMIGHSLICRLNQNSPFLGEIKKALDIELSPHMMAAKEFAAAAGNFGAVKRIILFGSVARGTERLGSDIDIAVVYDKKDKKLEDVITHIANEILEKSRMRIIPLTMTEKEIGKGNQFAEELKKGEILYERAKRS